MSINLVLDFLVHCILIMKLIVSRPLFQLLCGGIFFFCQPSKTLPGGLARKEITNGEERKTGPASFWRWCGVGACTVPTTG